MLDNLLMDIGEKFLNLWESSGLAKGDWQNYVMILVSFVLMYLAIVKKFEPLLLLPIAFGMFIINIPGAQDVVWGKYETPDLNLSLGKNGDGTLEYIGSYVHNVTGEIIYLKDLGEGVVNRYLKDGQVCRRYRKYARYNVSRCVCAVYRTGLYRGNGRKRDNNVCGKRVAYHQSRL